MLLSFEENCCLSQKKNNEITRIGGKVTKIHPKNNSKFHYSKNYHEYTIFISIKLTMQLSKENIKITKLNCTKFDKRLLKLTRINELTY